MSTKSSGKPLRIVLSSLCAVSLGAEASAGEETGNASFETNWQILAKDSVSKAADLRSTTSRAAIPGSGPVWGTFRNIAWSNT